MNRLILCVPLLLLCLAVPAVCQSLPASCHSIVLTGEITSSDHFEKTIGAGLVFRLAPERSGPKGELNGWYMTLVPKGKNDEDYIYPVSPPLRFNPMQDLGPSYGDDTKTSLGRPHEMRFLLNQADYERIWPLVTNALWPYSAPHPDQAGNEYVSMLKSLTTGQLKVTVTAYDADPTTGSIHHINFRAEFTVPENFEFEAGLKPKLAVCPARQD